jgi:hypothetical protein
MSYLPGYKFDVFVSYAHVNNEPVAKADQGWVDTLVANLQSRLGSKLGRSEAFELWKDDQKLRGNNEATTHLPEQVKQSALFLAVLSPGYVSSTFCLMELQTFLDSLGGSSDERLFIVDMEFLDETLHEMPDPFRDPRKYPFWRRDSQQKPRTIGWPLPIPEDPYDRKFYYPQVEDLAEDIVRKLAGLSKTPVPVGQPTEQRPAVLLAQVTDDLDDRRDEVRRYLSQAGVQALPANTYPLAREGFEKALAADLAKCGAFVQLLGPRVGPCPPDVMEGFGKLQLEAAKQLKLPILQWYDPALDISRQVISPVQKLLLQTAEAVPFEDFKAKIVRTMQSKPKQETARGTFTFINAADVDIDQADIIARHLGDSTWEIPLPKRKPPADVTNGSSRTYLKAGEIDESIVENFRLCDSLLVVYGRAPVDWVRAQLQAFRKYAPERTKEIRILAVVMAGDWPKEPIRINLRGLRTVNLTQIDSILTPALG